MISRLKAAGVKFESKSFSTQDDFLRENSYDVVFNCLGMGAREFCNDNLLVPVRGQMIRVIVENFFKYL